MHVEYLLTDAVVRGLAGPGPDGPGGRRMAHAEQGCAGPLCLDECGGCLWQHASANRAH